jgi:hypothetical protein
VYPLPSARIPATAYGEIPHEAHIRDLPSRTTIRLRIRTEKENSVPPGRLARRQSHRKKPMIEMTRLQYRTLGPCAIVSLLDRPVQEAACTVHFNTLWRRVERRYHGPESLTSPSPPAAPLIPTIKSYNNGSYARLRNSQASSSRKWLMKIKIDVLT